MEFVSANGANANDSITLGSWVENNVRRGKDGGGQGAASVSAPHKVPFNFSAFVAPVYYTADYWRTDDVMASTCCIFYTGCSR